MDLALHELQELDKQARRLFSDFPKGLYPDEISYMYIRARYYYNYYSNYPRQNQTCVATL